MPALLCLVTWGTNDLRRTNPLKAILAGVLAAVRQARVGRPLRLDHRTVPPRTTARAAARALPPVIREFTGRDRELETLRGLVPAPGVRSSVPPTVAIYGQPGTGKSALAVRFAHAMRGRYPDAQLYVDLKGAGSRALEPVEALEHLVRLLGVEGPGLPTDPEGLARLYRQRLQGCRAIVVLDNAARESQVRPLLPGFPTCLVVITSRHPLLGLTGTSRFRLSAMSEDEAVALLARIAGDRIRSSANRADAADVAQLCGYLPLALSIAGVRLRSHPERPVADLVSRLDQRRLREVYSGELDVRVSFDVSYEHLSPREQTLFRRLRLLPEPTFGPLIAAALLDATPAEAEAILERLVDEQMLEHVGAGRYGFHDLIGQYADEKLAQDEPAPQRRAVHERALRVYLEEAMGHGAVLDPGVAELAGGVRAGPAPLLEEQVAALDWFELERTNLVMASRQAAHIEAHDVTWQLAASLVPFFDVRGHLEDWEQVQEAALRAARASGELRAIAWTELGAGHLFGLDMRRDEALAHLEEAHESALAGGWRRLQGRALYLMGRVEHDSGQLEPALGRYERAAAIFHDEGMVLEQATTILYIAAVLHEHGVMPWADLAPLGEAVMGGLESLPERLWVVRTLGRIKEYLARKAEQQDDNLERADAYWIASSQAFQKIGFRHGYGRALQGRGRISIGQRSWSQARDLLDASTVVFRMMGDRYSEGMSLLDAGEADEALGSHAEARIHYEDAAASLSEVGAAEAAEEARSRIDSMPE